jgi:hypothetical protein
MIWQIFLSRSSRFKRCASSWASDAETVDINSRFPRCATPVCDLLRMNYLLLGKIENIQGKNQDPPTYFHSSRDYMLSVSKFLLLQPDLSL